MKQSGKLDEPSYRALQANLRKSIKTEDNQTTHGLVRYYYTLVQKKNKNLGSKERLLVLFSPFIAYLSELPRSLTIAAQKLEGEKKRYDLRSLTGIKNASSTELQLTFKEKGPTDKVETVEVWGIKFQNEKLCKQWSQRINSTKSALINGEPLKIIRPEQLLKLQKSEALPSAPRASQVAPRDKDKQQVQQLKNMNQFKQYIRQQLQNPPVERKSQVKKPQPSPPKKVPQSSPAGKGTPYQALQQRSRVEQNLGKKSDSGVSKKGEPNPYRQDPAYKESGYEQRIDPPYRQLYSQFKESIARPSELKQPEYKPGVSQYKEEVDSGFNQILYRGLEAGAQSGYTGKGSRFKLKPEESSSHFGKQSYNPTEYVPKKDNFKELEFAELRERQAQKQRQLYLQREQQREESARQLEQRLNEERSRRIRLEKDLIERDEKSKKDKQKLVQSPERIAKEDNLHWFRALEACARESKSVRRNGELLEVLRKFKAKMSDLVVAIVNDLGSQVQRRKYKPTEEKESVCEYLVDNVSISLASSSEVKLRTKQGDDILYDQFQIKLLQNDFKYHDYLSKHIYLTLLRDPEFSVRVPLSALVYYKGFVALAVSEVLLAGAASPPRGLDLLADSCNLVRNVFQDENYIAFKPMNPTYYRRLDQQLSQKQKKPTRSKFVQPRTKFELLIVDRIFYLLPQDQNYSKNPQNKFLRGEYVARQSQPLLGKLAKAGDDFSNRKLNRQLIQTCEKLLQVAIPQFVEWLEEFREPVLNSRELAKGMHAKGINMRYLGKVAQAVTMPYFRSVILSEVASRAAKKFLRKNLQDDLRSYVLKSKRDPSPNEIDDYLLQQTYDFLSLLLGTTAESQKMWKILSKQAKYDFGIEVFRHEIPKPVFLLHLVQQLDLKFSHQLFEDATAVSHEYQVTRNMVEGFEVRAKVYSFDHEMELLKRLRKLPDIRDPSQRENQTGLILENNQFFVPPHLQSYEQFIAHTVMQHSDPVHLWPMTDAPNADIYTIWLTQLKWAFKDRREGISYFKQLTQKLVFWYGDHNPMLNRVYQLYAEEYIAAHEYEDALIVAKNELVNSLKVFGNSNPNTAQAYVHTGQILVRLSKRDDALNYYLKACQVFESKGRKASIEWASIASRAALLMLSFGRLEESATMCKLCCRVFSERGKQHIEELINCYETLGRIHQINGQMSPYLVVGFEAFESLRVVGCEEPALYERALKIALYPILDSVKSKGDSAKVLLTLLEWLKDKIIGAGNQDLIYQEAFQFIKGSNQIKNTMETFYAYLQRISPLVDDLFERKVFSSYRGFLGKDRRQSREEGIAFLQLFESVVVLSGESFIQGVLQQ